MFGYYPNPKLRRLTNDELRGELEREIAQTVYGDDEEAVSLAPKRLKPPKGGGLWTSSKELSSTAKRPPSRGSYGEERTVASKSYAGESRSYASKRPPSRGSYGEDRTMASKSYAEDSRSYASPSFQSTTFL